MFEKLKGATKQMTATKGYKHCTFDGKVTVLKFDGSSILVIC